MKTATKGKLWLALCAVLIAAVAAVCAAPLSGARAEGGESVDRGVTTKPFYATDDAELIVNGDFSVQDLGGADSDHTQIHKKWVNHGWVEIMAEGNCKITYAWQNLGAEGEIIGVYQDIDVAKNTDYYLAFQANQAILSGGRSLTVGITDPKSQDWMQYVKSYSVADIHDIAMYYVKFNSGELETVRLRFATEYLNEEGFGGFGGFFLDNVSFRKVTGEKGPSLDVTLGLAENSQNYLYDGTTATVVPEVTNLLELGIAAGDVTFAYESSDNAVASVSANGTVTPGEKMGLAVVTVTATYEDPELGAISGTAAIKFRHIARTDEDVFLDPESGELPLIAGVDNLLKNPSFETPIDTTTENHATRADNWRSTIGTWMNAEGDGARTGDFGCKITWRWDGLMNEDQYPGFYQDVDVEPYTTYELSFYVFNWKGVANGHNDLFIGYRNPNGEDVFAPVQEYAVASPDIVYGERGEGNFTLVTCYLDSGEFSTIRVFAYTQAQSGADGGAGWWFDDWSLKKVAGVKDGVQPEGLATNVPSALTVGANVDLKSYAVYTQNFRKDVTGEFAPTFESSNPGVVKIENGKLTAVKEGTATVTAKGSFGGLSLDESYTIKVNPKPVSLTVKVGADNSIALGRDQKISVTVTYSDNTTKTLTANVAIASSNESIVKQQGTGLYAVAKGVGKATLTATATVDGVELSGSVEVTVVGDEEPGGESGGCKGCNGQNSAAAAVGIGVAFAACLLLKKH